MFDEMPLTAHLEELRKRLVIASVAWLVAFVGCYSVAEKLFKALSAPVQAALPKGSSLVFIQATEPFFTYLKVAAVAAVLVALPVILWQIWGFIAPGLYKNEKRFAIPFVLVSCLFFGTGTFFGFTFVFPTIFTFLVNYGTVGGDINAMLSMGAYLTLSTRLLFAFGMVFELPIVIFFLARMGIVDHKWLSAKRKYAFLMAFVVGAILTPPDVFSQVAIAIPFVVLYEVGILAARLFGKKKVEPEPELEDVED